jgi:hypothetical protein
MSPVRYELGFYIQGDILHSHRLENLKSYIALTGWDLAKKQCVSCEVRTGFYIPEDGILHRHRRDSVKTGTCIEICRLH